jgi:hypothetical protein
MTPSPSSSPPPPSSSSPPPSSPTPADPLITITLTTETVVTENTNRGSFQSNKSLEWADRLETARAARKQVEEMRKNTITENTPPEKRSHLPNSKSDMDLYSTQLGESSHRRTKKAKRKELKEIWLDDSIKNLDQPIKGHPPLSPVSSKKSVPAIVPSWASPTWRSISSPRPSIDSIDLKRDVGDVPKVSPEQIRHINTNDDEKRRTPTMSPYRFVMLEGDLQSEHVVVRRTQTSHPSPIAMKCPTRSQTEIDVSSEYRNRPKKEKNGNSGKKKNVKKEKGSHGNEGNSGDTESTTKVKRSSRRPIS